MNILDALFFSAALAVPAAALATDPPPRVGATKSAPEQDQAKAKDKPVKDAPNKAQKPKRRAAYQQFDELPMRTPPTAVYAPTLTPRQDAVPHDRLLPRVDPTPAPPATINCVGAACTDAAGGSYRGGVGTSLINQEGRICNNNGITVQCH